MKIACPHCSQNLELDPETLSALEGASHFDCPTCGGAVEVPAPVLVPAKQAPPKGRGNPTPERVARRTQQGMSRNLLVLAVVALLAIGGVALFLASKNGGNILNTFQNVTNQIINNSYFTQLIADGVTTKEDLESVAEIRPYGDGFIGVSKAALTWEQAQDLAKKTGAEVLGIEDSAAGTRQQLTEWLNTTFAAHLDSTLWVRQDAQTRVLDRRDVMSVTTLDSPRNTILQWNPNSGLTTTDPSEATKDLPFANGLGMKFVPVPITGGPTNEQPVLFSIWETRVADFSAFATETGSLWPKPNISQDSTHPAVKLTWHDAIAFCEWLTTKERKAGRITLGDSYRLPSDHEWSFAIGIGGKEDPSKLPSEKDRKLPDFPWDSDGKIWPPPSGFGNYAGAECVERGVRAVSDQIRDAYVYTAPVGTYPPNNFGLFDLSGNVWEWCEERTNAELPNRVIRGACYGWDDQFMFRSCIRNNHHPDVRSPATGFRVVLSLKSTIPESR